MTAELDAWIRSMWPHGRPSWDISVFREMHEDELRRVAQARAASVEGQKIAALERRLAALERALGPDGSLINTLGAMVARLRQETKAQIEKEFVKRQPMIHRGIWGPEVEYQPGHVVTHGGAAWAARIESKGSRPGTDGVWRLIAKGNGS